MAQLFETHWHNFWLNESEIRLSAAVVELGRHIIGREASFAVKRAEIES